MDALSRQQHRYQYRQTAVKVKGKKANALKRYVISSAYMRLCGQGGTKRRLNSQKLTLISISY